MQNAEGTTVDLYVPRKCSATNRLIQAKDHGSVQINIAHVDANGTNSGAYTTVALCGFVRQNGAADAALTRIWDEKQRGELRGQ
ncbi:small subunit ribosomal protein S21e, cytoplasmic [Guillardia theta CCMP2712]|uniref:40S ribosomal protein S21 n=1 Tax=Guillardia theta (strain CCMP2712) TaxID=905079 RepID=L1J097_GUITC|nr:small subunit ribosomal protein S21e, cytoplasmic [Guillardia theta CCMP2712]EKX41737.1 small subunit ribosomal protein S21e, cytoplasmic [Guillardia theta CCMP2712]|eukprot:XP_005828717.1 small subunit ribosomal protein S21e, cytoplasmic [Guillardia theta CCMP2712]